MFYLALMWKHLKRIPAISLFLKVIKYKEPFFTQNSKEYAAEHIHRKIFRHVDAHKETHKYTQRKF